MTSNHTLSLNITFRGLDATDALRNYANEKLSHCVSKFLHQDAEGHLVLKVEKSRQIAELSMHANGSHFNASQESEDLYKTIDLLADSVSQQMRKHKEKLKSHH